MEVQMQQTRIFSQTAFNKKKGKIKIMRKKEDFKG